MSLRTFLKNSKTKIFYVITIYSVVNAFIICSQSGDKSFIELLYINLIFTFITACYSLYDYIVWKKRYIGFVNALKNRESFDHLTDDTSIFELELINKIIKAKNEEMYDNINTLESNINAMEDFLTRWVHEIKIPISVAEIIIDKLCEDAIYDNDLTKINNLKIEIERIKFFVEQVLYTSRSYSYSEDLEIVQTNLDEAVKSVLKKNSLLFMIKNINLNLNNLDFNVLTDKKWLTYIIGQIVNNSCKYVELNGKIDISANDDENRTYLVIRDNGIGVSKKDVDRMFDRGFTGTNGRKNCSSTGMGLYLSNKMAKKLGHVIMIESEEQKFTQVTISFAKVTKM